MIAYFLVTIHTNVQIKCNKRSVTLHNAGQGCHSLPILTIMCYVVLCNMQWERKILVGIWTKIYEQCITLDIVRNSTNEDCWKPKDPEENMFCPWCVEFVSYPDSTSATSTDSHTEISSYTWLGSLLEVFKIIVGLLKRFGHLKPPNPLYTSIHKNKGINLLRFAYHKLTNLYFLLILKPFQWNFPYFIANCCIISVKIHHEKMSIQ